MKWKILLIGTVFLIGYHVTGHCERPPVWVEAHLASDHSEDGWYAKDGTYTEYNESNLGLGVMVPMNRNVEVGFGFFENSYNNQSLYSGFDLHTTDYAPIRVGVSMAIVTGYQDTPNPTNILVLPNVTTRIGRARVKVGLLPGPITLVTITLGVAF